MNSADYSFEEITVGQKAAFTRVVTQNDVEDFAKISGDYNPLHLDPSYAAQTVFTKPIAHGMLLASFCSALIGMHLPGKRALYVSQTLNFKKPVYAGDTLVVEGVVTAKSESTQIIELEIKIKREEEEVFEGVAKVKIL